MKTPTHGLQGCHSAALASFSVRWFHFCATAASFPAPAPPFTVPSQESAFALLFSVCFLPAQALFLCDCHDLTPSQCQDHLRVTLTCNINIAGAYCNIYTYSPLSMTVAPWKWQKRLDLMVPFQQKGRALCKGRRSVFLWKCGHISLLMHGGSWMALIVDQRLRIRSETL